MTDSERINEIKKMSGLSFNKLASEIGLNTVQTLYDISKGKHGISKEVAEKIQLKYLNVNPVWLLTGDGEMLKHPEADVAAVKIKGDKVYLETKSGIKYYELSDNKYRMRVPLVPFNAYARYINEACEDLQQERETWDEVEFIVDKIGHGSYMAFEIKGDSMDDDSRRSFIQGDYVLARELDKAHWGDGLRYNKYPYWIIVLKNTILCKEITGHDVEAGEIICHSLNPSPEYADFTVNLKDVCRLFNIVQKTSTTY